MIGAIVYPLRVDLPDGVQQPASNGEIGWFVNMPDAQCALCAAGLCVQRVLSSMGDDALVIHGVLGQA